MDNIEEVEALRWQAERLLTPCGDGSVVWHRWAPSGGLAEGPPVLLLHGGSGSWTHWARNIDALRRAGRQVLVPDMPGFGDSATPPDGHDADVLPGWLERGLQQLAGDAPVDLVGFSLGGLVAGLWAHAAPLRPARLVLVGSPALGTVQRAALDLRRWDEQPAGPAREAVHRHNLLQLMLADERAATPLAVRLHGENVERDRLRQRRLMLTDALLPVLPGLRCPLHGIWGAQDVLYAKRMEAVRRGLMRAPQFVALDLLPGAGHWVQWEAATAFDTALAGALGLPQH